MERDQNTSKGTAKLLVESFLVGFASTAGMLAVVAVFQYHKCIGEYAKKVARYAIQEAR